MVFLCVMEISSVRSCKFQGEIFVSGKEIDDEMQKFSNMVIRPVTEAVPSYNNKFYQVVYNAAIDTKGFYPYRELSVVNSCNFFLPRIKVSFFEINLNL